MNKRYPDDILAWTYDNNCFAANNFDPETIIKDLDVVVKKIRSMPLPKICLTNGNTLRLICNATGNAPDELTWCGLPVAQDDTLGDLKVLVLNEKDYLEWWLLKNSEQEKGHDT